MGKMTPLITAKRIQPTQLAAIATGMGLPHIGGLQSRPDLIGAVVAKVDEILAGQEGGV